MSARALAAVVCVTTAACSDAGGRWDAAAEAGNLAFREGRLGDAERGWTEARAVAETFPATDDRRAVSLWSLASVYKVQGRLSEAAELLEQCLALDRERGVQPGASTAEYLLAAVYQAQARFAEAEPLLQRVLDFHGRSVLGEPGLDGAAVLDAQPAPLIILPQPTFVVGALHQLARIRMAQRRYAEADPLLDRAERVALRTVRDTGHVAVILGAQADLRRAQGRAEAAVILAQQALVLAEGASGKSHHLAGQARTRLGRGLLAQGRAAEADVEIRRGLAVQETALGPEHLDVADTLLALAEAREALGRGEHAERARARAIDILQDHVGPEHPHLVAARARHAARPGESHPRPSASATAAGPPPEQAGSAAAR